MLKRLKRIMRKFQINEISACDKPAQEHAQVLIMKRDSRGQGIMDEIIDDTPSDDELLLDSVRSILEDEELDTTTRNVMLLDTMRQYVVYTGADTATARPGAPLGGLSSPDMTITAIHKRAEQDRRPDETIAQARERLWADEFAKRAVDGETQEQRRNRLKQERAERDGPQARSSPVQNLRKLAAEPFPELSVARAVAKFAASRDPQDRAIWNAAKDSE
jgi:hypothetical protein